MEKKKLIAYLVLVHDDPDHFIDLIHQLNCEEVCFFVHIDKKAEGHLFSDKIEHLKNVFFVSNRVEVSWGGFSLTEAVISVMKLGLSSDYDFKYFVFVSGNSYPIKSNRYILDFF